MSGNVKLVLRTNHINKQGEAPIVLRLTKNKKNTEISTGIYIAPERWSFTKHRIKINDDITALNQLRIEKQLTKAKEIINKLEYEERHYDLKHLSDLIKGKSKGRSTNILEYLMNFVEINPENLGKNTLRNYHCTATRLSEYDKTISFDTIDVDFLIGFEKYLANELGNRINTIHGRMKVLRKLIRRANREGITSNNPFKHHSIKTERTTREYLNLEELEAFKAVEITTELEGVVKDAFIFGCATGLRFSDICRVASNNIHTVDGRKYLRFRMKKTQRLIRIPLINTAISIIQRYNRDDRSNHNLIPIILHPRCSQWDETEWSTAISSRNALFNRELKGLIAKAGIKKSISFHCSRHTFAITCLNNDISMEEVRDLLGQMDIKVTQIYAKVLDSRIDRSMDLLDKII